MKFAAHLSLKVTLFPNIQEIKIAARPALITEEL